MNLPRLTIAIATLLTWSLLARPSLAEDTDDTALAEALFQEGRRLFKKASYEEACPKFEESYRIVPKLGTLLNLATCHDKVGKTGSAWGEYTKAVTLAKEAGEQERVAYARDKLDELEPRLSRLVIEVPEPVAGIEVLIDEKAIGRAAWRTPIPLDPGDHEIVAQAEGHLPWSRSISIAAEPGTITVNVPALQAGEQAPAPTPVPSGQDEANEQDAAGDSGTSGLAIAGWVVGGIGLVGVGVGSYFGVNTFMKQGDSDDHCEGTLCDQQGVDLRDEARTSATISTITFALGGAALAAGVTMLIIDAVSDDDEPAASASVRVAPVLGGGTYGATMGVTW